MTGCYCCCERLQAFTAIEAMSDGGVKMGLPRDLAIKLAAQTMLVCVYPVCTMCVQCLCVYHVCALSVLCVYHVYVKCVCCLCVLHTVYDVMYVYAVYYVLPCVCTVCAPCVSCMCKVCVLCAPCVHTVCLHCLCVFWGHGCWRTVSAGATIRVLTHTHHASPFLTLTECCCVRTVVTL